MYYKGRKEKRRTGNIKRELEQVVAKPKVGIDAQASLVILILILSGAFRTSESVSEVMDFTNLCGNFGQIGETGANFIGKGGSDAKGEFMAGLDLIPVVMFFRGVMRVFEQLGAFKASDILFRPMLRPILNILDKYGVASISSLTGSDVATIMTRELADSGELSNDERAVFVAYQYVGSACINNTATEGAPLIVICPVALGPVIVIEFVCKFVGVDLVRLILKISQRKGA